MRGLAILVVALLVSGFGFVSRSQTPTETDSAVWKNTTSDDTIKSPPGKTTPLSAADLKLLYPNWFTPLRTEEVPGTDLVRRSFSMILVNSTIRELASVTVRFKITLKSSSEVIYTSKPIRIDSFSNLSFPSQGSLFPRGQAKISDLVFTYPSDDWRWDSADSLEFVSAEGYADDQDLHIGSHLYWYLFCHEPKDTLALFQAHPDLVNVKTSENASALFMALSICALPTVKYIVEKGDDLNASTKSGETAIHCAARNWNFDVIDYTLSKGQNINVLTLGRDVPLSRAILAYQPKTVAYLLKKGADPNIVDKYGVPAAYWAIYAGASDSLEILAKGGANIHFHDKSGQGWLHYAIIWPWDVEAVLQCGVPVDDEVGPKLTTPLMLAALMQRSDAAMVLLKHGANPYRKDSEGHDSFYFARKSNTLNNDAWFRSIVDQYWAKVPSK